jgi:signal transduction histidine kinase
MTKLSDVESSNMTVSQAVHDIRNILALIEIMFKHVRQNPGKMEVTEAAYQTLINSVAVLEAIRDIDAGKLSIANKEFRLYDMLGVIGSIYAWFAAWAEIGFAIDCPEHLFNTVLKGDPQRTKLILVNLVHNAFNVTVPERTQGDKLISLRVREVSAGMLEFMVEDNGPGMTDETLAAVRGVLDQANQTPSFKETGLGMRICRTFSRALRAEMRVESMLGRGSTFVVRVPFEVVAQN